MNDGRDHIYSQFQIRNCWQGEKIFFLESVACSLSWVRVNLVGFDFLVLCFWILTTWGTSQAAASLPRPCGILQPLPLMLASARAHLAAEELPCPTAGGSPWAAAGGPRSSHPARAQCDHGCSCFWWRCMAENSQPTKQQWLSSSQHSLPWVFAQTHPHPMALTCKGRDPAPKAHCPTRVTGGLQQKLRLPMFLHHRGCLQPRIKHLELLSNQLSCNLQGRI